MLFYLSFASDSGFLGAFITDAPDEKAAHAKVNLMGCNPGGEIVFIPCPEDDPTDQIVRASYMDRLLSKADLVEMDEAIFGMGTHGKHLRELDEDGRAGFDRSGYTVICEKCNSGEPHEHHP